MVKGLQFSKEHNWENEKTVSITLNIIDSGDYLIWSLELKQKHHDNRHLDVVKLFEAGVYV